MESIHQLVITKLLRPFTLMAVLITFCIMAQVVMAESRGSGSSMVPDPCAYYACGTCDDQTTMFCSDKPACASSKCSDVIDRRGWPVPANGSVGISPTPDASTLRNHVKQPQNTTSTPEKSVSPKIKPTKQHQKIKSSPSTALQENMQPSVGTTRHFDEADAIFGKRTDVPKSQ